MSNTINPTVGVAHLSQTQHPSLYGKFMTWCENQQEDRLLWLGIALTSHGCVITPITILFIVIAGLSFPLFMIALLSMTMALVANLAALPTKITIPVLVLSVAIDVAVLLYLLTTSI
jgi:hypothetical protein